MGFDEEQMRNNRRFVRRLLIVIGLVQFLIVFKFLDLTIFCLDPIAIYGSIMALGMIVGLPYLLYWWITGGSKRPRG